MQLWQQLLNAQRRKPSSGLNQTSQIRTELERDYDRILFAAPIRRLADKTQVFPLEKNDSVRTRLTHSHEVSNLARSIGINLVFNHQVGAASPFAQRDIPAVLAAIGLAHDVGNPPFGHQGEAAIQTWFAQHQAELFEDAAGTELDYAMRQDFLSFEGNAQTLRLLTRLQVLTDEYGLNLCYGTLAALLKYPVGSDAVDKQHIACKKQGFFQSEKHIVADIWQHTGLSQGHRHPLTYIMEACDDIAYSVLDAEDAVKKGLVSFVDVLTHLQHIECDDAAQKSLIERVSQQAKRKNSQYRALELSPSECNDISMQMFRVYAITHMVAAVTDCFLRYQTAIEQGAFQRDLVSMSEAGALYQGLIQFNRRHAYQHPTVLKVELDGYNALSELMDYLWQAISQRKVFAEARSPRTTPFANYTYGRISDNYRRIFEDPHNQMPMRYRELQLLTDMVSGMTDSYALSMREELRALYGQHRTQ